MIALQRRRASRTARRAQQPVFGYAAGWAAAVIVVVMPGLFASAAAAAQDTANWTAMGGNVATGTLSGKPISLSGTHLFDPPVSVLDDTWPFFAGPDFTPSLAKTDVIQIGANIPAESYTIQFALPVRDPVIYVGSLASRLDFPSGTQISRVSGDNGFTRVRQRDHRHAQAVGRPRRRQRRQRHSAAGGDLCVGLIHGHPRICPGI